MFIHESVEIPKIKRLKDVENFQYEDENGNQYQSVTTFISNNWDKTYLNKWKKKVGHEKAAAISKRATTRGTGLHKQIENYLNNKEILTEGTNELVIELFGKVQPALIKINKIKLLEKPLFSEKLKLAGTPDCIAEYNETLAVIDFKTSTRMKRKIDIINYFLQAACYGIMYEEHLQVMPENAVIIMAVEAVDFPMLYIEPMEKCVSMLNSFIKDPIEFQNKLEIVKSRSKKGRFDY